MATLTYEAIVAEVRRLATDNPDYVYQGIRDQQGGYDGGYDATTCLYNNDAENSGKGCIFGQALTNLGHRVPGDLEGKPITEVLAAFGVPLNKQERIWLRTVQVQQDGGKPWDGSVRYADAYVGVTPLV